MSNAFEQRNPTEAPGQKKTSVRGGAEFGNRNFRDASVRISSRVFAAWRGAEDLKQREAKRRQKIGDDAGSFLEKARTMLMIIGDDGSKGPEELAQIEIADSIEANRRLRDGADENFFRMRMSEFEELARLSPGDLDKAENELMSRDLTDDEAELARHRFEILRPMLHEARRLIHGASDHQKTLEAYHALRQSFYPVMELLASAETKELSPVFDGLKQDTVEFLCAAVPGLDRGLLERRAAAIGFEIRTALESSVRWERVNGIYNRLKDAVYVTRGKRRNETTMRHEILHGLNRKENGTDMDFSDSELDADSRRFLVEAIVEELSQFIGEENLNVYQDERYFFASIRRGLPGRDEIPLAVFAQAMFGPDKSLRRALSGYGLSDQEIDGVFEMARHYSFNLYYEEKERQDEGV